ncbi:hypothetical protein LTR36_005363 [Oleoguttula mirabilis]|uniref:DUF2293 domain-containing protein n=1 Tax=Oleoguttula mirabilis TaxID=1507867 RepID=A0AAV9JFZ0_9PEZI|nr:hypothetical protein LTR36_005363 [Oleoguttula mirabilis]
MATSPHAAQPVSKHAVDPDKVSHHIHRIGYHFKADVVEEACEQLGYTLHKGHYVKEADLLEQHQKSAMAQTLRRFGIDPFVINKRGQSDTLDQVRMFIKELFPKMPAQDLNEIVRHAWEEGTKRVGNSNDLDLPRRAQLATIARIRHMYTDYDRLLRAFEWKEARSMVEPECLKKLIEWRGETEDDDDDELEEIVRETIVLDSDDEDAGGRASEADDENSIEVEPGDASEVEITHHTVSHDDIAAESGIDGRSRLILDKLRPKQRDVEQRSAIAKQKIGAVREQLRARHVEPQRIATRHPAQQPMRPAHPPVTYANGNGYNTLPVHPDEHGRIAREMVVGGRLYELKLVQPAQGPSTPQPLSGPGSGAYHQPIHANTHSFAYPMLKRPEGNPVHEQPVTSIERATPDRDEKRRRIDQPHTGPSVAGDFYRPVHDTRYVDPRESRVVQAVPQSAEVVDLTSPRRSANGIGSSLYGHAVDSRLPEVRFLPVDHRAAGSALHSRPAPGYAVQPQPRYQQTPATPVSYDARQFMTRAPERYIEGHSLPNGTFVQYGQPGADMNGYPHVYQPPPQPVHGAPAPVQQVVVEPPRQYIPADGAVAPTQYYYPR